MKSYTLRGEQNKEDKFIAYMLPTDTPEHGAGAASTSKCAAKSHADRIFPPFAVLSCQTKYRASVN